MIQLGIKMGRFQQISLKSRNHYVIQKLHSIKAKNLKKSK